MRQNLAGSRDWGSDNENFVSILILNFLILKEIVIMKKVFFALTALIGFNSVSYGQDIAQDRIFKGWFLSPHEFPWMVKLKVRNTF